MADVQQPTAEEAQLLENDGGQKEDFTSDAVLDGTENGDSVEDTNTNADNGTDDATESEQKEGEIEEGSLINAAENDEGKMFIGGLSWETQTKDLKDYLSKFGEVKDCTIKIDNKTGKSRGFGFVLFATQEGVEKVLESGPHKLDGRTIDPKKAKAQKKDGKLFAGGINPETSDEKVREYFSQFGEIEALERPFDKSSQKPKGFCFITYKKDGIIDKISEKRYHELDGRKVECKSADPPPTARGGSFRGGRGGGGGPSGWGNPGYGGYSDFAGNFGYGGYSNQGFGGPGGYGGYGAGYGGPGGYGGGNWGGQGGFQGYGGMGGGGYGGGGAGNKMGRGRHMNNFRPY